MADGGLSATVLAFWLLAADLLRLQLDCSSYSS